MPANVMGFADGRVGYALGAELKLTCLSIRDDRCGAVGMRVGDLALVFGKRPPDPADQENRRARAELDCARSRLADVGAEEVCSCTFGPGYLLVVQPSDPLAEEQALARRCSPADYTLWRAFLDRLVAVASACSAAADEAEQHEAQRPPEGNLGAST